MVVCKFFQQGYCRFGQSCRFEHIYGSKYSYHASTAPATNQTQSSGSVTDEQLVNTVHNDIQSALKGGQWILSCYSPFKVKSFPGLQDLSPEECRLMIYEAKASNKLDEAIAYINNLTQETRQRYEQLVQPNASIARILRSLYNGESPPSPFTTNQITPANIFRNAAQISPSTFNQNTAQSIFAQANTNDSPAKSIFAQATQNAFTNQVPTNVFASAQPTAPFAQATNQNVFANQNTAAKSIFAQANQNVFAQTPQTNSSPQNVFATATRQAFSPSGQQKTNDPFGQQNTNDPFGQQKINDPFSQQTAPNDPFKQQSAQSNPFGQQQPTPANIFQTAATSTPPSNFFGSNVFGQQTTVNSTEVYSKEEELSEKDLEAFRSETFKLGFVPEIAPPQSLCV